MADIKVTVAVPVYNCAEYLNECIDSILNQTLKDIEVILIDDGSTDDSLRILQSYAEQDSRVTVLTQKNQYAGTARNNGLSHASGEYIIFWDSDDWFEANTLEMMYEAACRNDADLVICDAADYDHVTGKTVAHNYIRKPFPETDYFSVNDCPDRIFDLTSMDCWNKLVRRSFMLDNSISFPPFKHINDTRAVMLMLTLAERIVLVRKKLVHHRINRGGSLMTTYSEQPEAMITACEDNYRELSSRGVLDDPIVRESYFNKIAALYFYTFPFFRDFTQFQEYFGIMLGKESLLSQAEVHEENPRDIQMYADAKDLPVEEFLYREFVKLTKTGKEQKATIAKLKNDVKKLKKNTDKIKEQLKEANALNTELEEKNFVQDETIKSLEQRLDDAVKEIEELQGKTFAGFMDRLGKRLKG